MYCSDSQILEISHLKFSEITESLEISPQKSTQRTNAMNQTFSQKNSMADTPKLILSDFISIKVLKRDVTRLYSRFHSTEVFSIL